jgi:hypothetical protein
MGAARTRSKSIMLISAREAIWSRLGPALSLPRRNISRLISKRPKRNPDLAIGASWLRPGRVRRLCQFRHREADVFASFPAELITSVDCFWWSPSGSDCLPSANAVGLGSRVPCPWHGHFCRVHRPRRDGIWQRFRDVQLLYYARLEPLVSTASVKGTREQPRMAAFGSSSERAFLPLRTVGCAFPEHVPVRQSSSRPSSILSSI